jgi:uncharacterized protein (TIGR00725 family)
MSSPPELALAVFGSSDAEPGSPAWERAHAIGRGASARGIPVVTGGYGGVMEAASLGASGSDVEVIGVTCAAFSARSPNPYLTLEIEEPDLSARTGRLIEISRAFVILEGMSGTLAELAMLWASARARTLPGPIVIWDERWSAVFEELTSRGCLDHRAIAATRVVRGEGEALTQALTRVPGKE